MKKTYYHGTSADNLESILKNGLLCSSEKIWECSNDEIYAWNPEYFSKEECSEDGHEGAFRNASESAQIACSFAKDCRIVVVKFSLEDKTEEDYSCEGNKLPGAVCIQRDVALEEIDEIQISNNLSAFKPFFLSLIIKNKYYLKDKISEVELLIAELLTDSPKYWELHGRKDEFIQFNKVEIPQLV